MKKKVLVFIFAILIAFVMASCNNEAGELNATISDSIENSVDNDFGDDEKNNNDHSHLPSDWILSTESTCYTEGLKHKKCKECLAIIQTEKIPLKEHNYYNKICAVCGSHEPNYDLLFMLSEDETYYAVAGIGSCESTEIIIPTSYNKLPVKDISDSAFYNNKNITSIAFSNSIKYIGKNAFSGCSSLETVKFGNEIQTVGERAFIDCPKLQYVYINDISNWCKIKFGSAASSPFFNFVDGGKLYVLGEEVRKIEIPLLTTRISDFAFLGCSAIIEVKLPIYMLEIGECAFANCNNLSTINIPENVSRIGSEAFCRTSITSITIPDSCSKIEDHTFYGCSELRSVVLSDGVKSIEEHAFSWCQNLENLVIGNGITNIEKWAFEGCSKIKYSRYDEAYYIGNDSNPYLVAMKSVDTSIKSIVIHENTRIIYYNAFNECNELTDLVIPNNVIQIGEFAFRNCTKINDLILGSALEKISYGAFFGCMSIKKVVIPFSVNIIDERAFSGCRNLESVFIPKNVTTINGYAFEDAENLTIYCEANSKPSKWDSGWNVLRVPIVWGYKFEN